MQENTRAHPYSLVRSRTDRTGYVSGIVPVDDDGQPLTDPASAAARCLTLLAERLETAGFTMADVVRTTVYLTDIGWRDAINDAYVAAFPAPMPARTAVEVRALPRGAMMEVDAIVEREP